MLKSSPQKPIGTDLQPGFYGAFYKGTRPGAQGLFNVAVRWWDNGPYSHAEAVFSDGVAASSSLIDGGVRFKDGIDFGNGHWDLFPLPFWLEAQSRLWFDANLGAKYDLIGNARFVFDFLSHSNGHFNCSAALGASLGLAEAWRFTPNTLAAVCRTHRIWTTPVGPVVD